MTKKSKDCGKIVYTAFITLKNGRRIYAWQYGKKAFRFYVEK